MEICRICKGNCDSGELVGGICPECLEEERRDQERKGILGRMLNGPFRQMGTDVEAGGAPPGPRGVCGGGWIGSKT